jgi:hypothetical protein
MQKMHNESIRVAETKASTPDAPTENAVVRRSNPHGHAE